MWWLIGALIWIGCGIWAYGISKAVSRAILIGYPESDVRRYNWVSEVNQWLNFPFGLIALAVWYPMRNSGFCFRMPKELCKRRS